MSQLRVECGHQPQAWSYVVTDRVALLLERPQEDPLTARCAAAAEQGDLDDLLDVLLRDGWRTLPDFTAVDRSTRRVLARGTAIADAKGPGPSGIIRNTGRVPWADIEVDPSVETVVLVGDTDVPPQRTPTAEQRQERSAPGGSLVSDDQRRRSEAPTQRWTSAPAVHTPPGQQPPAPSAPLAEVPWRADHAAEHAAEHRPAPDPAEPVTPAEPDEVPAPSSPAPARAVLTTAPPGPSPLVPAVRCPQGHPNPPGTPECRLCREQVSSQSPEPTPQPALGVLELSTGERVTLDRDVLVGRAPTVPEGTPSHRQPHLLRVSSPGNEVSRNHVRVQLDEWQVLVTDLDSTNGTLVAAPGTDEVLLQGGEPRAIGPGTVVRLSGDVAFTYRVSG